MSKQRLGLIASDHFFISVFGAWLWHSPMISVHDVTALREVLITKWRTFDRAWYEISAFKEFLGGGLILARNDKWSHTRPALARLFSRPQLRMFAPVILNRAQQLCDEMALEASGTVDMQERLLVLSFDTIIKKCFGVSEERSPMFSEAFCALLSSSQAKMLFPFLRLPVDKILFFLPAFRKGIAARELLSDLIREHVRKARRDAEAYSETILGKLLEEGVSNAYFRKDEQIVSELLTVLFAGHDTTAAAMTFALYFLSLHPQLQEQCRQEAREAVWSSEGEDIVRTAESMHFIKSCLRETLRLKPSAPLRGRTCVEATTLSDDDGKTYRVEDGQLLNFSIHNVHLNDKYFPDPEAFKPERWSGGSTEDTHAFLAFGAGPRKCPGELLALLEGTVVLAQLLRSFSFALEDSEPVETRMQLTLVASHLRLKVTRL